MSSTGLKRDLLIWDERDIPFNEFNGEGYQWNAMIYLILGIFDTCVDFLQARSHPNSISLEGTRWGSKDSQVKI